MAVDGCSKKCASFLQATHVLGIDHIHGGPAMHCLRIGSRLALKGFQKSQLSAAASVVSLPAVIAERMNATTANNNVTTTLTKSSPPSRSDCDSAARRSGDKSSLTNASDSSKKKGNEQQPHRQHTAAALPHIETLEFLSFAKMCRAGRYKVHRPGCDCGKMEHIRSQLLLMATAGTSEKDTTDLLSDQMSKMKLSPTAINNNNDNKASQQGLHDNPLDGLVVVPDPQNKKKKKTVPAVYCCPGTGKTSYDRDRFRCERLLQKEIFGDNNNHTDQVAANPSSDAAAATIPSFKISCAQCLLEDEPNGFVCLGGSSLERLNQIVQESVEVANRKRQQQNGLLHADHAHHVCILEVATMQNLRTEPNSREAKEAVLLQLQRNGMKVDEECLDSTGHLANNSEATLKMGHHLSALLELIQEPEHKNDAFIASLTHWMVLVYNDDKPNSCWTLDLPGGKRHLGESTLECAIRETEEESSLQVDPTWLTSDTACNHVRVRQLHDGTCNLFYLLEEPTK